jgi:hypothetical protein
MRVNCWRDFSMKNCVIFLFYVLLLFERLMFIVIFWLLNESIIIVLSIYYFFFSRRKIIFGTLLGWGRGWERWASSHNLYYFCVVFVLYFFNDFLHTSCCDWLNSGFVECLMCMCVQRWRKRHVGKSLKKYRILNGSFLIQILKNWVHGATKNLEPSVSSVHYLQS